ncbi:hypothetical protein Acr_00g0033930 [Actinidia rufa]|uniref:Uncharacterized protein n=1 Tax=Actinidia rufa TaxID=165716 RepID=A0A7J0DHQ5_9ERIC|nr:hypothetical protein Acr_00g0033930 [Actinidia rufa]
MFCYHQNQGIESTPLTPKDVPMVAVPPSVEKETNIMTLEELDLLRESYSFPPHLQLRIPEEGESITSARPGEVAFSEAAFLVGFCFPIHSTIRLILQFYNICPAQLIPNAWRRLGVLLRFISRSWCPEGPTIMGHPRCNNPTRLYGDEVTGVEHVFSSIEEKGLYSVPTLLESKSFCRVFGPLRPMAFGEENKGEDRSTNDVPISLGDAGSFLAFPIIFYYLGANIRPILGAWELGRLSSSSRSLSSSSSLGAMAESWLPFELKSDAMLKRINFKKLGQNVEKSKFESLTMKSTPAKRVVIGEKHLREDFASLPTKKGKVADSSKGKETVTQPKLKRKAVATKSCNMASSKATPVRKLGEGTSVSPGIGLGPRAYFLASPSIAEKILSGVIPLVEQKKVKQLTFDQIATKRLCSGLPWSYGAGKRWKSRPFSKLEKSVVLVGKLRGSVARSKEFIVEEFKSSFKYEVAVENASSKYFGEGFDFCKQQLRRHHLDLAIYFEGMGFDHDLLAKEDENEDEENWGDKEGKDREKGVLVNVDIHNGDQDIHDYGDRVLMATRHIIGNISSSVRRSRGEEGLSHPCLPANKFLFEVLKLGIPISIDMTDSVPYTMENGVSPFNRPFEEPSLGVRLLENLPQGLVGQHSNRMHLKIVLKLPSGNQKGSLMGELPSLLENWRIIRFGEQFMRGDLRIYSGNVTLRPCKDVKVLLQKFHQSILQFFSQLCSTHNMEMRMVRMNGQWCDFFQSVGRPKIALYGEGQSTIMKSYRWWFGGGQSVAYFLRYPFLIRIGLDFFKPLDEFLVFDLREHLGDGTFERGQYQLRGSIHEHMHTCTCIDGVDTSVEVPDLLNGGSISSSRHLVVTTRRSPSPSDFPDLFFGGWAPYAYFRILAESGVQLSPAEMEAPYARHGYDEETGESSSLSAGQDLEELEAGKKH